MDFEKSFEDTNSTVKIVLKKMGHTVDLHPEDDHEPNLKRN